MATTYRLKRMSHTPACEEWELQSLLGEKVIRRDLVLVFPDGESNHISLLTTKPNFKQDEAFRAAVIQLAESYEKPYSLEGDYISSMTPFDPDTNFDILQSMAKLLRTSKQMSDPVSGELLARRR